MQDLTLMAQLEDIYRQHISNIINIELQKKLTSFSGPLFGDSNWENEEEKIDHIDWEYVKGSIANLWLNHFIPENKSLDLISKNIIQEMFDHMISSLDEKNDTLTEAIEIYNRLNAKAI